MTATPTTDKMNLEPLEVFVTDFAMLLAGSVTNSDTAEGLSPEQLGVVFFSAIGARARQQPDYDPEQDISGLIRLGVAAYGESVYATVNASLAEAQTQLQAAPA